MMSKNKKTDSIRKGKPSKGAVPDKPEVPAFDAGVTTKDSAYRDRVMRAVQSDRWHPVHHGIKMQAHHLISASGMHASGMGPTIKKFGYDINQLPNLVLLPCTLQGACHLGVQPHRGNHTADVEDERYKDDEHPRDYHDSVKDRLKNLRLGLTKDCPGYLGGARELEARMKVKRLLDDLSSEILEDIQRKPRNAPLTKIAQSFQRGSGVGCGGVDSTSRHAGLHNCPVQRNHRKMQGADQRVESITYEAVEPYKLKAGK
jgi:hypothetical protein